MKDYKYLASSQLVTKKIKRDYTTRIVGCIGGVMGLLCWLWFIDGILG